MKIKKKNNNIEYCGRMTQNRPESSGRFRKVMEGPGTCRNIVEFYRILLIIIAYFLFYIYSSNSHFRVT